MSNDLGVGWQPDPEGRHQLRYHDGTTFTAYVSDNGIVSVDAAMSVPSPRSGDNSGAAPFAGPPTIAPTPAMWPAPQGQTPFGGNPVSPYGGASWPGTSAQPPAKTRRVALPIAISIAVLEGIAIIVLIIALVGTGASSSQPIGSTVASSGSFNQSTGTVVYSSNFASNDHWPTGNLNSNTTASLSNGEYLVHGSSTVHHLLLTPYFVSHQAISVETEVGDFGGENTALGVGCQSSSGIQPPLAYQLMVFPNGRWYIEQARIPGTVEILASGYTADLATTATLQLACVVTDSTASDETTQLVAYVNGARVGGIGDRVPHAFVGFVPMLVFESFGPTVNAAYNEITVRSINP